MVTVYRLLRAHDETGERRRHSTHPARVKPELLASAPNQCWSWDLSKLPGPAKWTWYYLTSSWTSTRAMWAAGQ
jgi:putative transposase